MQILYTAFIALALAAGSGPSTGPARSAGEQLASLEWLAGTWHGDGFETHYSTPDGGMILSLSKWIDGGVVQYYEFERIEVRNDAVLLTPHLPGDTGSVSFTLTGYDTKVKKARFVNPAHDFPKEISFEQTSRDRMTIVVAGEEKGTPRTLRFELKRRK